MQHSHRSNEETPKYGGTLEIASVYCTLSALSWDTYDWQWKHNHDTGQVYEQLFAADLSRRGVAAARHPFVPDALHSDRSHARRTGRELGVGRTAALEIKLRKGVMFPEKPGVMRRASCTADDVVTPTTGRIEPEEDQRHFDHVGEVEATDSYTVVFNFKEYNAEWDYRFG